MGNVEEIEQIRDKIERHSLTMSRVPKKTKLKFQEIAVDFDDDYGMTLKMLIDHFDSQNFIQEVIAGKLLEVEDRLKQIEGKTEKSEKKTQIKLLSGKVITKEVKNE
jgi:hypothetical protein